MKFNSAIYTTLFSNNHLLNVYMCTDSNNNYCPSSQTPISINESLLSTEIYIYISVSV